MIKLRKARVNASGATTTLPALDGSQVTESFNPASSSHTCLTNSSSLIDSLLFAAVSSRTS
jgi:hypothetical protein